MKRVLLLVLALALGCGLFWVSGAKAQTATSAPIYFEGGNHVWKYLPSDGSLDDLFVGILPSLSPSKTKLAYYNDPEKQHPVVYNLITGKSKVFKKFTAEATRQPSWSPSGSYFTIESHTSTFNAETVLNSKTGKKLVSFDAVGNFYWISNTEIVFSSMHDVDPVRPRGTGGGTAFGISKINVKTGKIKVLKTPSVLVEYLVFDLNKGKIRYTKFTAKKTSDWKNTNKIKMSYYKMNKSGKGVKKISMPLGWAEKISAALTGTEYKDYFVYDYSSYKNTNWRIFTLTVTPESSDNQIFIMNYPDVTTLKRIADGTSPAW